MLVAVDLAADLGSLSPSLELVEDDIALAGVEVRSMNEVPEIYPVLCKCTDNGRASTHEQRKREGKARITCEPTWLRLPMAYPYSHF
jgi:hypothetical protein